MANILMSGCDYESLGKYLRKSFEAKGHRVFGIGLEGPEFEFDITAERETEALGADIFKKATDHFNAPVDIVFLHQGLTRMAWFEDFTVKDFSDLWKINCLTSFIVAREFVRQVQLEGAEAMQPGGYQYNDDQFLDRQGVWQPVLRRKLVFTGSIATSISLRNATGYVSAKGALESMMLNISKELAGRYPVTVLMVAPGGIKDSIMTREEIKMHAELRDWTHEEAVAYSLTSNTKRKGTFEEYEKIYNFALFEAPEYMTGSIIPVANALGVR
jgi:NAD(P)-dependent dehydrogenase (short-subunit alcohol dehydrogenase family)